MKKYTIIEGKQEYKVTVALATEPGTEGWYLVDDTPLAFEINRKRISAAADKAIEKAVALFVAEETAATDNAAVDTNAPKASGETMVTTEEAAAAEDGADEHYREDFSDEEFLALAQFEQEALDFEPEPQQQSSPEPQPASVPEPEPVQAPQQPAATKDSRYLVGESLAKYNAEIKAAFDEAVTKALTNIRVKLTNSRYVTPVVFEQVENKKLRQAVLTKMVETAKVPVLIAVDSVPQAKKLQAALDTRYPGQDIEVFVPRYDNDGHMAGLIQEKILLLVNVFKKQNAAELAKFAPHSWIVRVTHKK